jgi:hypothetical protein
MTVAAHRTAYLPADRGGRQHLKIMQMLAAVDGDGATPLVETLVSSMGRIRRGMTVVVITPSLERDWLKPLANLRTRGVGSVVVTFDVAAFDRFRRERRDPVDPRGLADALGSWAAPVPPASPRSPVSPRAPTSAADRDLDGLRAQRFRAVHHGLAEYDIRYHTVVPGRPLAELLHS